MKTGIAPLPYTHALKKFGTNLQKIRREKEVTQEKLAELIGVHRTYITLVEKGERNPSLKTIYRIAKALKVSSTELLPF